MLQVFRHLITNKRGNVAAIFGLALPAIMVALAGSIDYASWLSTRAQMQAAADTSALAAAKELRLAATDPAVVASTAKAQALAQLGAKGAGATVTAQVLNNNTQVQVQIDNTAPSLFGAMAPTQFTHIQVRAIARTSASTPVCLLALSQTATIGVGVNLATINSPGCGTYSDSKATTGLTVVDGTIQASQTCSSGGYVGVSISVSPAALTDCPTISDPLSSRPPPAIGSCDYPTTTIVSSGSATLFPGTYCGGLTVTNGGTAVLSKGVYIIKDGPLIVNQGSTLKGSEVGFYLSGDAATLNFDYFSSINLKCPKDGPLAGLLFFEDRSASVGRQHVLTSHDAPQLLGTLYFPRGNLTVGALSLIGTVQAVCQNLPLLSSLTQCPPLLTNVANESAWTIVIANQIIVNFGVRLTLNTNYSGTSTAPPEEIPMGVASLAK